MTGPEYKAALCALSLSPSQAADWLGISLSTTYKYMKTGCDGPVAGMLRIAVELMTIERWDEPRYDDIGMREDGSEWVLYSDLTAAVGLPG